MRLIPIIIAVSISGCASRQSMIESLAPQVKIERLAMEDVMIFSTQTQDYILENGQPKAVEESIESVKRGLKDPYSAIVSSVELKAYKSGVVVCGNVNAKNSYGAYTGNKRFVASPYGSSIYDTDNRYVDLQRAANAGIVAACGYM